MAPRKPPFILENRIKIEPLKPLAAGATLTIQPGAVTMFNEFSSVDLTFDGTRHTTW